MPRPEQMPIPGTEGPVIKDIEKAAAKYLNARDARMALTKKEVEAKRNLIDTCHAHAQEMETNGEGTRIYRYADMEVVLSGKEDVKVRPAAEEEEE